MGGQVVAPVLASEGEERSAAESWSADRLDVRVRAYEPEERDDYVKGPAVPEGAWAAYLDDVLAIVGEAVGSDPSAWLILAGSLPDGAPLYSYGELIPKAREAGIKVAVDLRGEVLGSAIVGGPDLVRLDASHAGTALGRKILSKEDAVWAAMSYGAGADGRIGVVTGTMGVVLVDAEAEVRSSVPTGPLDADSLVAALAMTLTGGIDSDTALMLALGAASRG
jgi:1-phosphofructokinase